MDTAYYLTISVSSPTADAGVVFGAHIRCTDDRKITRMYGLGYLGLCVYKYITMIHGENDITMTPCAYVYLYKIYARGCGDRVFRVNTKLVGVCGSLNEIAGNKMFVCKLNQKKK